ncbi:MAG: DnaJ domain-containing protein [Chryseotalea sp.]
MVDYYQIMGLKPDASSTAIRSAYKKLAMLYHPDRNPNNPQAEELFKVINEAYQVLSDPIKKQQYDLRYHGLDTTINHSSAHDKRAYWREYHHKQYQQWRQSQQQTSYQFDKRYFKIQGLAIATFLVIAGICFGIIHIIKYVHNNQQEKKYLANVKALHHVHELFNKGNVKEAITQIRILQKEQPLEYIFSFAEDTLLFTLQTKAENFFDSGKFALADHHYTLLHEFQEPVHHTTLLRMAECKYALGEYSTALDSYLQLDKQHPENVSILCAIATVYQDKLLNFEEAEKYLTLGKKYFKRNMTLAYGEAFEIVANPQDVSEIYYHIFLRRLQVNLELKNYTEAETDGNWAIYLRPNNANGYFWRAKALQKTGNKNKMCADLSQASQLGLTEALNLAKVTCP